MLNNTKLPSRMSMAKFIKLDEFYFLIDKIFERIWLVSGKILGTVIQIADTLE